MMGRQPWVYLAFRSNAQIKSSPNLTIPNELLMNSSLIRNNELFLMNFTHFNLIVIYLFPLIWLWSNT